MISKLYAITLGVAAALLLPAASVSAQVVEGPAMPIPEPTQEAPEFLGKRATPNPVGGFRSVPENPFMAANGESNLHVDAYATDVNEISGPLGGAMTVASRSQRSECASHTFDSQGRLITVCVGLDRPTLVLMDPITLEALAVMPLPPREPNGGNPFTEFGGGGYFYLDDQDRAVIPTIDRHIYVVEVDDSGSEPELNQVADYDLNPALADDDTIVSALPDYAGRLWFAARSGIVGYLDFADSSLHPLDTGEGITNSFALDEDGGVYIVTDRRMYRFGVASNGDPIEIWRERYPNNFETKPGQVDDGSGTTPTLMGTRLVAINDNSDPMKILVYKRRAGVSGEREVCRQSVFPEGQSATDNSLIATDRSIVVENNYGYEGPQSTEGGGQTAPGIARIDLDETANGCSIRWVSEVNSPTVVPKLSLANGLIYVYAKEEGDTDPWYLTAIDFRTGRTIYQRLSGEGLGFNNNYAPITIGPDSSIYVGVLDGIVRLADVPGQGGDGPSGEPGSCGNPSEGTDGNDRFIGTRGADGFFGADGNDSIKGLAGNDCLSGGDGADQISGSGGEDAINGGRGIDDIRGGQGADKITAGKGGDSVRGGGGDDELTGKTGRDVIRGGGGDDVLEGGKRSDRVRGGAGDDKLKLADGSPDVANCGEGTDLAVVDPGDRVRPNCERVKLRG